MVTNGGFSVDLFDRIRQNQIPLAKREVHASPAPGGWSRRGDSKTPVTGLLVRSISISSEGHRPLKSQSDIGV
jgi:hypothetical protein